MYTVVRNVANRVGFSEILEGRFLKSFESIGPFSYLAALAVILIK